MLSVGAVQGRKNQYAALAAAQAVGLPLVVVGPEKDPSLAAELRASGATLRGYVEGAAVLPSRYAPRAGYGREWRMSGIDRSPPKHYQ